MLSLYVVRKLFWLMTFSRIFPWRLFKSVSWSEVCLSFKWSKKLKWSIEMSINFQDNYLLWVFLIFTRKFVEGEQLWYMTSKIMVLCYTAVTFLKVVKYRISWLIVLPLDMALSTTDVWKLILEFMNLNSHFSLFRFKQLISFSATIF